MLEILTLCSMSLAVVMTVVAWRATRLERQRSEARVAALAGEIYGPPDELPLRDERSARAFQPPLAATSGELRLGTPERLLREGGALHGRDRQDREPSSPRRSAVTLLERESDERRGAVAPEMFATAQQPTAGSRYGVALAAAAFVVATIAAVAIVFSSGSRTAATAQSPSADGAASDGRGSVPLELVALSHERVDNTLTVRGIVRNPEGGSAMDRLTAVVYLFDSDGGFLASGRAAVESASLIPGGESTFVVNVPVTATVARYRVSFRSGDRIVAHLDKRSRF